MGDLFGEYMELGGVEEGVEKEVGYYVNMEKRERWEEMKKKV